MKTVGFIGIGLMGRPMSERLLAAGFELVVWNRSVDKCQPLLEQGAKLAEELSALAHSVDVICLCLTDTAAVQVVFDQLEPYLNAGQVVVDFSSIDPLATQQLANRCASIGVDWIDSPVSGGVQGARAGSLAIMVGGKAEVLARLQPLLSPLSSRVTHMGENGAGQYTKICNQMIVSCQALVIAEVVAFAESAGVNSQLLSEAFAGGFADSKPLQILAPEMAARRFTPEKWHVKTLLKDLDMAVDHSRVVKSSIPMSGLAAQLMRLHANAGNADKDPSTLVNLHLKPNE